MPFLYLGTLFLEKQGGNEKGRREVIKDRYAAELNMWRETGWL